MDFNFFQKFTFGIDASSALIENDFLSAVKFSKKDSIVDDANFNTTIAEDLARYLIAEISVNAVQCYGKVNHVTMSLVWFSLVRHTRPITVLLTCPQTLRIFQHTGFCDLDSFLDGGKPDRYLVGSGQSRGGASPS